MNVVSLENLYNGKNIISYSFTLLVTLQPIFISNTTGRGGRGRGGRGGRGRGRGRGRGGDQGRDIDIKDYNGPILQLKNPMRLQRIPTQMPERNNDMRGGDGTFLVCFVPLLHCNLLLYNKTIIMFKLLNI